MATKEELAATVARRMADTFAQGIYGPKGPALDCDIDEIEEAAVLAARAAFDAVIARALELQQQRLPDELPCPDCGGLCPVKFEHRTIQGRMGPASIQEPFCSCPACKRDFFPSAGSPAAG
jgi:hypothetical protein